MSYTRKTDINILLVENKRLFCYAFLWGIPFAISCVLGWRLVHEGTVFGGGGSAAAYVGSFLLFLLETAVLSVGDNADGSPSVKVISDVLNTGADLKRSDERGNIVFEVSPSGYIIK